MTIRQRRISMMKETDEMDKDKESSPLRDVLIHERHQLHTWKETVEIRPPNILVPRQIASHVNVQPLCKLAVSPKCDYIAVMSHRRTFQIYRVTEDENIVAESSVQILEDANAEYCIFEFSASGTLLLSTRSDGSIDVFDRLAEHCYTMLPSKSETAADLVTAISSISSYSIMATEEKFSDYMATLQYDCTLSTYKMGRTSYFKMFTVKLDFPLTGVCRLLRNHEMILVSTHYKMGSTDDRYGLASYRIVRGTPYLVPVIEPELETDWWKTVGARIPFLASFGYISSLSVDEKETRAVGVTSTGDVLLVDLPSLNVTARLNHTSSKIPRPRIAQFVHGDEIAILFTSGHMIRVSPSDPDRFISSIAEGGEHSFETYSTRTQLVVPSERELFALMSEGGPEVAIPSQRSSLAIKLFLLTIWRSLKQLLGMAVGDAAAPLQQATQLLSFDFSIWHAPIVTLEELLDRTMRHGDFTRAIQLAEQHPQIEKDAVYKRQWLDICKSGTLTKDHVKNVLGRVRDVEWKADQCLHSTTLSRDIQMELVSVGIHLDSLPLDIQVHLAHHGRLLTVMDDDIDVYLEMRDLPLKSIACGLAQRCSLVALERLLVSNWSSLSSHSLSILSQLPSSIHPKRYERLIPNKDGQLVTPMTSNTFVDVLSKIRNESEKGRKEVEKIDWGNDNDDDDIKNIQTMEQWAEARAKSIDIETGIVPYAIKLLELCKERGCESLDDSLIRWKHLDLFVRITQSVSASLDFLTSAPVSLLAQHFSSLDESTLISSLSSIIQLLQWHSPNDYLPSLKALLTTRTTTSTKLLHALKREKPELLDEDLLLESLSSLTLTGEALLESIDDLPVPKRVVGALKALHEQNVHPTFGKLLASQTDSLRAREVLSQLVHCNMNERRSADDWRRIAQEALRLSRMLYSSLLSEDETLEMVAERFVLDSDFTGDDTVYGHSSHLIPLSTLLNTQLGQPTANGRLSTERSALLLLRLCESFIASSVSGKDDQLVRAKILAEAAKHSAPKESQALVRSLDVIGLAAELGSGRLPIQIKHADPLTLLEECIAIGDNYKRGKRCARLSQLLRVETPVATAYARCALIAVERGDEATLALYIKEVSSTKSPLPVVHTLCMKLLSTHLLPELRADIEASALSNASEDQLEEVLARISELAAEVKNVEEEGKENDERIRRRKYDKLEKAPLDPNYTRTEEEMNYPSSSKSSSIPFGRWTEDDLHRHMLKRRHRGHTVDEAARELSHESATGLIALAIISTDADIDKWTGDEQLKRYTSALRHSMPKLNSRMVERIVPKKLIDRSIVMDENSTALDRLEAYGISRERFVEDEDYRLETIDGLAMMEDDSSWRDTLELASIFNIPLYRVHLASLENILTSLSPSSGRSLISHRNHSNVLNGHSIEVNDRLRKGVHPLINNDDVYLFYLEQFTGDCEECQLRPLMEYIHSKGVTGLKNIMRDETRLAQAIVQRVPTEDMKKVAEWLHEITGTSAACDAAARMMLGTREDPARILPLLRDADSLIELLGDIDEDMSTIIDRLLPYTEMSVEFETALRRKQNELRQSSIERQQDDSLNYRSESPIYQSMPSFNLTQRRRGN